MTAPAPALSPAAPRPARWERLLFAACWLLLTVYLLAPPREAMTSELDPSNHGTYAWMFRTGQQFGADVVPMTGPWGFLIYGLTYSGDLEGLRLVGDVAFKAVVALLLLAFVRRTSVRPVGFAWLGLLVVFVPCIDDLLYDVAILVAGLLLLTRERRGLGPIGFAAAGLLGFAGLLKGTHLMLAGATLAFVAADSLLHRRDRAWVTALGTATTVFLAGWLGAGQHLANIPGYVRGTLALASGYNASMGLAEPPPVFATGLALAGGTALLLTATLALARRRTALPLLFVAFFSFVKWKHGFLRADGHVYIFFTYATLVAPTCAVLLFPRSAERPAVSRPACAAFGVLAFCFAVFAAAAASEFWTQRLAAILRAVPAQFARNGAYLCAPAKATAQLALQLDRNRAAAALPRIRNEVGNATIDYFGFEQGVLLLNGLNYHPRPMGGGSFNVFHPHLLRLNDEFIRDPLRQPEYYLAKLRTLDGRLPAMDDSTTLNALLLLYAPICLEHDQLLLRRRPGRPLAPRPTPLATRKIRAGAVVELPTVAPDELLLFTLDAHPTFGGRLRGICYRPPLLEAELSGPDLAAPQVVRLVPTMLTSPVLLSPLLENNDDLLALFEPSTGKRLGRLVLRAPDGGYRDDFTVSFYSLPRPRPAEAPDTAEIRTFREHPLHNREPLATTTQETGIRELNKEPILLVHAPGETTFPLRPDDRQLVFSYGLMPQAYEPGQTDGVEFTVEIETAAGTRELLFQRLLQPVEQAADRGIQSARLFLPAGGTATRLHFRTGPGPHGNGAWDQSFLARIQIRSGPPDPRQYFGFNATPEAPGFAGHDPVQIDFRPARLLHAPSLVAFPIPAEAAQVTFGFGILPGAYADGNHTDGVEFSLEIEPPAGARQPLHSRLLDPLARPADRGTQILTLDLPPHPPGSRLWLRTSPGPRQDAAWDWSYVQTVFFHR